MDSSRIVRIICGFLWLFTSFFRGNCFQGCEYFPAENRLLCSGITPQDVQNDEIIFQKLHLRTLELRNITGDDLRLEFLEYFPEIRNFSVLQGNLKSFKGNFPAENNIEFLQFKNLSIDALPNRFFKHLNRVKVLDLRGNLFETLDPESVEFLNGIQDNYLTGNRWNCSMELDWVLQLNSTRVKDLKELMCYKEPFPRIPLLPVAHFKKNVQDNCPKECECWMLDVVKNPEKLNLEPIIEVNCSDRGLKELPAVLPEQTKVLMLQRNSISSLEALVSNPLYRGVLDLYLDSNFIDTVENLEGSYWLAHFRALSLSNNKLSQLPTYALDNALRQNPNMPIAVRIYLANNPWRCDCLFTPGFQEMLRKYENQVRDVEDIKCSYVEGDENSLTQILELSRGSVCHLPTEYWVRGVDLLNVVLASLIVLILGKLAYDYYYFKKTGRLPWIVTKMP